MTPTYNIITNVCLSSIMVVRWCSGQDVGLATFDQAVSWPGLEPATRRSLVPVRVMTLLGYFWDRWPYFAGKLSWDVTTTQVNSALHPSGVAKSSTSFGWGKGGKVTSAGWQVTLCDPIWHVISRSSVVISITNCYIRVYFTLLFTLMVHSRQ